VLLRTNRNRETTPETTLQAAGCGKQVRITRLDADHDAHQRLCEMGFCQNAAVLKIAHGAALICLVCGVRVAISARLAERIFVQEAAWS
jgi:Fe2+ transport system protein FeoA